MGSAIDPAVAAALLEAHLTDFFSYSPSVSSSPDDWCWHTCASGLHAVVGIPSRLETGRSDRRVYHVLLDATYYDLAPLKLRVVAPSWAGEAQGHIPRPTEANDAHVPADRELLATAVIEFATPRQARGCSATSADGWIRARSGTKSFPWIAGSPGAPTEPPAPPVPFQFALHDTYTYRDGTQDQLVCFSYSYDYYEGHTPSPGQAWRSGHDRVDATLNRLYEILNSPSYIGPSKVDGS